MRTVSLCSWTVSPHNGGVPIFRKSVETGLHNKPIFDPIPATVPGSIYRDLIAAGYIDDPFVDMNALKCEWVSSHWWLYRTEFELSDEDFQNRRIKLCFEGIDCKAHIFFNGNKVGYSENMFVPFEADVTELCRNVNTIEVAIEEAPVQDGAIGYTSRTEYQKARFNYKWDFCPKMISMGIYRPAYIKICGRCELESFYFKPMGDTAYLTAELEGDSWDARITACLDGKTVELRRMSDGTFECILAPKNIKRWYPAGEGEPYLYSLILTVYADGEIMQTVEKQVGFRTVRLIPNDQAPAGAMNYLFEVNGKPVYIKGANMTPADITCVNDYERVEALVRMSAEANMNMLRIWGGGVIEDEMFYQLCDKYGIMVWQDFNQSSSGIDNIPSKKEKWLEGLYDTAVCAVKRLRNHPSMCVWCGGNELTDDSRRPVDFDDRNIGMLYGIVRKYSPHIPMLPTTGSGPYGYASVKNHIGMNHDVHGLYKFRGESEHYDFFNRLDSLFNGEFSVDGMNCTDTLKRIFSEPHLHVTDVDKDPVWRFRGEWWDTSERDGIIFGEPKDLDDMVARSQFIQAEGIRYILEANRRRAFRNSGSLIWQLNECFPSFSNTALIDYYLNPKPVLKWVSKAYAPLCVSLAYDKLVWEKNEKAQVRIYVTADGDNKSVSYRCTCNGGSVSGSLVCGEGRTQYAGEMSVAATGDFLDFVLTAEDGERKFHNKVRLLVRGEKGKCSSEGLDVFMKSL